MHRPRRIFESRIALNRCLPGVGRPVLANPSWPLGRDFGGDKMNDVGPQQQKGLPVEIRKPLLHNYSIGCGGPATPRRRHSLILPYRFELIREVAA